MPELARMTRTALDAAKNGKSKDSPLTDPKKLAAAGVGIAALPVAIEQIKRASHKGDLDEGIAAEKEAFTKAFVSEDAREGIGAFLGKRTPEFKGK